MPHNPVPAPVQDLWRTFATTINGKDPQQTITAADLRQTEATKAFAPPAAVAPVSVSDLPSVPVTNTSLQGEPVATDFEVRGILGEGGMGRVLLARQKSLQRDVALKVLKGNESRRDVVDTLLVEAVTTGSIEHPSIVPVHALGRDKNGLPVLVMKRIDGVSWRQLLREPDHYLWASLGVDAADRFETHLEILMTVCNAVHYAHNRGIIHRDIKLDNVMIGGFGEVYLVDWGIALHLADVHDMPRSPEEYEMPVGTLAYMAPEMALGNVAHINERTDVYLLGATLHYLLVGKPRHVGKTPMELLMSARDSEPFEYGPEISPELAAICHQAMHVDPAKRFSTALELRQALASYRRHRGSLALSSKAFAKMAEMDKMQNVDERRMRQAMTECRFAFMQALEAWSGNESAREGLDEVLTRMIHDEIGQRDVESARALLTELTHENHELAKKIDHLAVAIAQENENAARLQAIGRNTDIRVDARPQLLILSALPIFTVVTFVVVLGMNNKPQDNFHLQFFGFPALMLLVLLALFFPIRKQFTTTISRKAFGILLLFPTSLIVHRYFALTQGDTIPSMIMSDLVMTSLLAMTFAIALLPTLAWASATLLAGAVIVVRFPAHAVPIFIATCTVATLLVAAIWARLSRPTKNAPTS